MRIALLVFGFVRLGTWLVLGQTVFIPLGYLDGFGPTSEANAITHDGTKIVGYSTSSLTENQACTWTASSPSSWLVDGRIDLVPGVQNWYSNNAVGVSADGNVLAGTRSFGATVEAFYWTPADQIQPVPFPADPLFKKSSAWAVSANGQVVVGSATLALGEFIPGEETRAFRWDRGEAEAVYLPPDPGSSVPNRGALGVNGNGSAVVGWAQTSLTTQTAVRWDGGGPPQTLNRTGDTVLGLTASSISEDGSVIVGTAVDTASGQTVGFKWTAAGGMTALPKPTTGTHAYEYFTAVRVSANGRVIVGYGETVLGREEAIFWVDDQPFRVSDVSLAAGVLPPSWEPFRAYGVDGTGNSICGYGQATSGKLEAYLLVLDATPQPSLVAPAVEFVYNHGNRALTVHFETVVGLEYRILGGNDLQALMPVRDWRAGVAGPEKFTATTTTTGGGEHYFLQVEVRHE